MVNGRGDLVSPLFERNPNPLVSLESYVNPTFALVAGHGGVESSASAVRSAACPDPTVFFRVHAPCVLFFFERRTWMGASNDAMGSDD